MKWCVVVLMLLMSAHAGMRKREPLPPIAAEIRAYDESHHVDLQQIVAVEIGQVLGFWMDQEEVAVVERRDATPQELHVGGKFLRRTNAVFQLDFYRQEDGNTHIVGVVVFGDAHVFYTLEADMKNQPYWQLHLEDEPAAVVTQK